MVISISRISLNNLIGADIAAATVLISMGALLGRTTPIQLLIMGLIEIFVFAANEYVQIEIFKVSVLLWVLFRVLFIHGDCGCVYDVHFDSINSLPGVFVKKRLDIMYILFKCINHKY